MHGVGSFYVKLQSFSAACWLRDERCVAAVAAGGRSLFREPRVSVKLALGTPGPHQPIVTHTTKVCFNMNICPRCVVSVLCVCARVLPYPLVSTADLLVKMIESWPFCRGPESNNMKALLVDSRSRHFLGGWPARRRGIDKWRAVALQEFAVNTDQIYHVSRLQKPPGLIIAAVISHAVVSSSILTTFGQLHRQLCENN